MIQVKLERRNYFVNSITFLYMCTLNEIIYVSFRSYNEHKNDYNTLLLFCFYLSKVCKKSTMSPKIHTCQKRKTTTIFYIFAFIKILLIEETTGKLLISEKEMSFLYSSIDMIEILTWC